MLLHLKKHLFSVAMVTDSTVSTNAFGNKEHYIKPLTLINGDMYLRGATDRVVYGETTELTLEYCNLISHQIFMTKTPDCHYLKDNCIYVSVSMPWKCTLYLEHAQV